MRNELKTFQLIPKSNIYPTRKRSKSFTPIGNWSKDEDELLHKLILENSINISNNNNKNKKKQWNLISSYFDGKTPQQIMNHWNKVINPNLIKGSWTQEEDELLINWVQKHGETGWTQIAAKLPGRIGKQCQERWMNCLNPNVRKTEWTEDEDNLIISMQDKLGNKWSQMAQALPGRTDNQIKNRWNSTLKRRIQKEKAPFQSTSQPIEEISIDNVFCLDDQWLSERKDFDDNFKFNPLLNNNDLSLCEPFISSSHDYNILNDDSWMEKER